MELTLTLHPDLEKRLARAAAKESLPVGEVALRVLDRHLPTDERSTRLTAMLQSWLDEDVSAEEEKLGDDWLRGLDAVRLSERKLFPEKMKGVTW